MIVTGICDVCNQKRSALTCSLCGKKCCNDCITVSGICCRCAGGSNVEGDCKILDKVLKDKGLDTRI